MRLRIPAFSFLLPCGSFPWSVSSIVPTSGRFFYTLIPVCCDCESKHEPSIWRRSFSRGLLLIIRSMGLLIIHSTILLLIIQQRYFHIPNSRLLPRTKRRKQPLFRPTKRSLEDPATGRSSRNRYRRRRYSEQNTKFTEDERYTLCHRNTIGDSLLESPAGVDHRGQDTMSLQRSLAK